MKGTEADHINRQLPSPIQLTWIMESRTKVKEGEELWEAIAERFALGTIRLLSTDQHYIARGCNIVEAMMAAEQKRWLHGIHIA